MRCWYLYDQNDVCSLDGYAKEKLSVKADESRCQEYLLMMLGGLEQSDYLKEELWWGLKNLQ